MRKFSFFIAVLAVWAGVTAAIAGENFDTGVVINEVRWATRNVDVPGTFAQNPEDTGMFFQWNRCTGWAAIGSASDWSGANAANNPCPEGWRIPTQAELKSLRDARNIWTNRNGVNGRLFGTAPNQIFLPAVGFLRDNDGRLESRSSFGFYWSSTRNDGGNAIGLSFSRNGVNVLTFWRQLSGFSIRCVAE